MERFYNNVDIVASSSDGLYTTMIKMIGLKSPRKMRALVLAVLCCFVGLGTINGQCDAIAPVITSDSGDCAADDGNGFATPYTFATDGSDNTAAPFITEYIVTDGASGTIIGVYGNLADAQAAANAETDLNGDACILSINHDSANFEAAIDDIDIQAGGLICNVLDCPVTTFEGFFAGAVGLGATLDVATVIDIVGLPNAGNNGLDLGAILGLPAGVLIVDVPPFCYELGNEECVALVDCSNVCFVEDGSVSNVACDDNGTPTDPSDDTYTFDVTVFDTNGTTWNGGNPYGTAVSFGPFAISGGGQTITITDDGDAACTSTAVATAPATCSNASCEITAVQITGVQCDDNGTGTDPSDDTFTFTLTATDNGFGTTFSDDQGNTGLAYATAISYGPYPISGGDITVNITDDVEACVGLAVADAPATCSDDVLVCDASAPVVSSDSGDCAADDGNGFNTPFTFSADGSDNTAAPFITEYIVTDGASGIITGVYGNLADAQAAANAEAELNGDACISSINHDAANFEAAIADINTQAGGIICNVLDCPVTTFEGFFAGVAGLGASLDIATVVSIVGAPIAGNTDLDLGAVLGLGAGVLVVDVPPFCYELGNEDCITYAECAVICTIDGATVSNETCDNNGTPTDPSDDTYTFDVTVTATNGSTWNGGNAYGAAVTLGPFAIGGGDQTITITDDGDATCASSATATAPATCSDDACEVTAVVVTSVQCENSGTGMDPSDDAFTFTLTATANAFSTTFSDDQGNSGLAYATAISYGPYFISDGAVTVNITDDGDAACTGFTTVMPPETCSNDVGAPCDLEAPTVSDDLEVCQFETDGSTYTVTGSCGACPDGSTATVTWYTTQGGLPVGTGSPFDPAAAGVLDTDIPGMKMLFAVCECEDDCTSAAAAPVVLMVNPTPQIDFDGATDETCAGFSDGSITVGAFSGIPPYTINLTGDATATSSANPTVFSGLPPGVYDIEVTGATATGDVCSATLTGIVVEAGPSVAIDEVVTTGTCEGLSTGTATVTASASLGSVQYSFDGGPYGSLNTISGLAAGTHSVSVNIAGTSCADFAEFEIDESGAELPTVVNAQNTCLGFDLAAPLEASCDAGCDVVWYSEQFGGTLLETGATFDPIAAGIVNSNVSGTYTFWAECDCMPCGSDRVPVMMIVYITPPAVNIIGDLSVCPNSTSSYTIDPANAASSFEWFLDGVSLGAGTGPQIDITFDASAENRTITIIETDENGCVGTSSLDVIVEINQTVACKLLTNVSLDSNCEALLPSSAFVQASPYDESGYAVSSVVNDETGESLPVDADGNYTVVGKGTFTVTVTHLCSGNSCWSTLTAVDQTKPTLECPPTKYVACDGDLKPVWPTDYPTVADNCCIDADNEESYTYFDEAVIPAGTVLRGFGGDFAPSNWAEVIIGGDGTTSFSIDGTSLTIVSDASASDPLPNPTSQTSVVYTFDSSGSISFDWNFFTEDDDGFEGVLIRLDADGNQTDVVPLTTESAAGVVSGFDVGAGESLIIAALSLDGLAEPGILTITNFAFTTGVDRTLDPDDACDGGVFRTWQVTDCCGNVSETCSQVVLRVRPDVVDFPLDVNLQCNNDSIPSTDPDHTGWPTIDIDGVDVNLDGKTCRYIATKKDVTIPSPCAEKIVREWTVFDWCSGEVAEIRTQFITVMDFAPPTIVCPQDVFVASAAYDCTGTYTIPQPEVEDGCSDVTLVVTLSSGAVVSPGMSIDIDGSETISYAVSDDCGNAGFTCTQEVEVLDNTLPVAICEQNTVVSIGTDGLGLVCATTIDDGSYDNCVDNLILKVRRMDAGTNTQILYTDCVEFSCEDVGQDVIVVFRVYDAESTNYRWNNSNDTYNECMVTVNVQDKINATITCPPNKDLNCNADYYPNEVSPDPADGYPAFYNGEMIGYYPAIDNCNAMSVLIEDEGTLDVCGEGTINRTWTVVDDNSGEGSSCLQVISIYKTAVATFTGDDVFGDDDDILWPADADLDCTEFQSDNSLTEPENSGEPELVGEEDDCAQLFVGYTDQLLYNDPTACYKILRLWKVIDECQYDPDNGIYDGYWQHVQIIKVDDETAPVFDNCDDVIEFVDNENGCNGEVTVSKPAADACDDELVYTWSMIAEDGFEYEGIGSSFTGTYDVGVHTVTWTATDNCGNVGTCTHLLKVSDAKRPTPVCVVLYTTVMPVNGQVSVWATDFESGSSFDNCTAHEDLNWYVLPQGTTNFPSPNADISDLPTVVDFDCNDLGYQNVYVFVEDESGNWDACLTQVWINDSQGVCPDTEPGAMAMIQGYVTTEMNEMVGDVEVSVVGTNSGPFTTGVDGEFSFLNVPTNANYDIIPSKDINYLNGVTTYDLVLISQHILGINLLNSPYKIIAADANLSGSVTTLDLVKIRSVILNVDSDFAPNTSWRFVDMDFAFPNATNPFQTPFPEVLNINNLSADEMFADFIGVKIGDVNDSATPNNLLGSTVRNTNGELLFEVKDRALKAGQTYEVALTAKDFHKVLGYQYTINVEGAEILEVTPGTITTADNFGLNDIQNGVITTSWFNPTAQTLKNGEVVYTISLRANENTNLSNVLSVTSTSTKAEAYNNDSDLLDVAFTFTNSTTTTTAFELYQNRPNPFKNETVVSFTLPEAGTAQFQIMDISGKVLRTMKKDFAQGYNEIPVSKNLIEGSGVFYYRLETATDTATKKMIILE